MKDKPAFYRYFNIESSLISFTYICHVRGRVCNISCRYMFICVQLPGRVRASPCVCLYEFRLVIALLPNPRICYIFTCSLLTLPVSVHNRQYKHCPCLMPRYFKFLSLCSIYSINYKMCHYYIL